MRACAPRSRSSLRLALFASAKGLDLVVLGTQRLLQGFFQNRKRGDDGENNGAGMGTKSVAFGGGKKMYDETIIP